MTAVTWDLGINQQPFRLHTRLRLVLFVILSSPLSCSTPGRLQATLSHTNAALYPHVCPSCPDTSGDIERCKPSRTSLHTPKKYSPPPSDRDAERVRSRRSARAGQMASRSSGRPACLTVTSVPSRRRSGRHSLSARHRVRLTSRHVPVSSRVVSGRPASSSRPPRSVSGAAERVLLPAPPAVMDAQGRCPLDAVFVKPGGSTEAPRRSMAAVCVLPSGRGGPPRPPDILLSPSWVFLLAIVLCVPVWLCVGGVF